MVFGVEAEGLTVYIADCQLFEDHESNLGLFGSVLDRVTKGLFGG